LLRSKRVVETFTGMGNAVLNGALTSILASIPLMACELAIFSKFGFFMVSASGTSHAPFFLFSSSSFSVCSLGVLESRQ